MKKSKLVGIVTFHNAYNYGAFLQTFALQLILEESFDVGIVDYTCKEIKKHYKLIKNNNLKKFIKSCIFLIPNIIRKNNFDKCIKEHLNITNSLMQYDYVITGSDQVWNIKLTGGYDKFYSLEHFNNCKKISYAASVGDESLIEKNKDIYKKILSNIEFISVREEQAKNCLKKLTKKNITVCLDPTLLLSKKDWDKYVLTNKLTDKYIFSYFVGVTEDNYKVLNKISSILKKKVISYSENPKEKNIYKYSYTDDPFHFISKIKYADLVFTSSFHATVFSIIFNVPFFCMPSKDKGNRIRNLLKKLNLSNRIIENINDIDKDLFDMEINYDEVNKILHNLRGESLNWLFETLEGDKYE